MREVRRQGGTLTAGSPRTCERCGTLFPAVGRQHRFCSRCRPDARRAQVAAHHRARYVRIPKVERRCLVCERTFRARMSRHVFCSRICHLKVAPFNSFRRRALRDEVGDRDGWRCHLCHRRIDRQRAWPHPRSASLDHLIPVADGGPTVPENLAIAHLRCNIRRHATGPAQLRLIA